MLLSWRQQNDSGMRERPLPSLSHVVGRNSGCEVLDSLWRPDHSFFLALFSIALFSVTSVPEIFPEFFAGENKVKTCSCVFTFIEEKP